MMQTQVTENQLFLSMRAADKIFELITEENNPKLNLRVYITGGGCSGFQYGFTFDEEIQEDDIIITQTCSNQNATVKLLVDSLSYQYLENATIDFREGLQEEFVIHNPNAKTTCGCGSSFSIDEGE